MGELILEKARELFFAYGVKSVSMDDLARVAGISKKTIYQSFSDKRELVGKLVNDLVSCHKQRCQEVTATAADAIDEVLKQTTGSFDTWTAVDPRFFFEIERSFPEAWQELEAHKKQAFLPAIKQNLQRGMAEGLYRDDLDVAFTAEIRLHQLAIALQPSAFTARQMSVGKLVWELTLFYLHSITTEKGKRTLNKYRKSRNENRTKK